MNLFNMAMDPFTTTVEISTAPTPNFDASSPEPSSFASRPESDVLMLGGEKVEKEGDEEYDYARAPGFASYDLRPSARDGKTAIMTTWFDVDQSGNYDPRLEGKKQIRKEATRPALVRRDSPTEDGDDDERQSNAVRLSKLAIRQRGCSLVVPLKMTSDALKALASTIHDNWPGETYNILSDEYIQREALQLACSAEDPHSRRILRKRSRNNLTQSDKTSTNVGIPDPSGKEQDLTGHPAARGCVYCREIGQACPLMSEDSTWPCNICVEDGWPCELLTPPIFRAKCEICKSRKLPCSYVHDQSDPAQPCAHCVEAGSHCVAGPGPGGIKDRISYDRDWSKPRPADPQGRRYVTCFQCRGQYKRCSLKNKTDIPPCDGCLSSNTTCTFEKVIHRPRRLVALSAAATSSPKSPSIPSESEGVPEDARMINAALCHPVEIMSEEEWCDWCHDRSDGLHNSKFGMFGYECVDVMVKPSIKHGGLAYEEICGGHAAKGIPNSVMCLICTMKRVQIIQCEMHEMITLNELLEPKYGERYKDLELNAETIKDVDMRGPYERLEMGALQPIDRFCDLCTSLALFKCCTIQAEDIYGQPISCELPEAEGCGLVLCEDCKLCHDAHVDGEANALDKVIHSMVTEKEAKLPKEEQVWEDMRADAELLLEDGLLMKKVKSIMEDGEHMDLESG